MIVCKKCGSQLPDAVRICPVCNTPTDSAAASVSDSQDGQPTYYIGHHEFMEDTFLGKMRARAKEKPASTVLLIILGCIALFFLIVIFAALMKATDGFIFALIWIVAGLWQIFHAKAKWRKKSSKYTIAVTGTIVKYMTISKRARNHRFRKHYYGVYEYEYNGMLVHGMSDDNYGSIPQSGTSAQILIKPDQPDRVYEPELEQGRIISDRIWGVLFALFGVALSVLFIVMK